jgi:hypothetical protein
VSTNEAYTFRPGRVATWLLWNGALAACLWYGVGQGVGWAENVVIFLTWLYTILYVFASGNAESRAYVHERGRSVPEWLTTSFDLGVACFFAAHGWFFFAVLQVVQAAAYMSLFRAPTTEARSQA